MHVHYSSVGCRSNNNSAQSSKNKDVRISEYIYYEINIAAMMRDDGVYLDHNQDTSDTCGNGIELQPRSLNIKDRPVKHSPKSDTECNTIAETGVKDYVNVLELVADIVNESDYNYYEPLANHTRGMPKPEPNAYCTLKI